MGIRKKVTIGFVSLALLVMGAGAVSFFELTRVGKNTQKILDAGNLNMNISRDLLDGAEMMHLALLQSYYPGTGAVRHDSLYNAGQKLLSEALETGHEAGETGMDGIGKAFTDYQNVALSWSIDSMHYESGWLKTSYRNAYMELTKTIKNYMTGAEYSLGKQAGKIEHNAYRAITPSLVTLMVILLLLFVLLFFIDFYYMRPVVQMNKRLDDWIKYSTPFRAEFEGKDEAYELKENIEELIDKVKRAPKPEQ